MESRSMRIGKGSLKSFMLVLKVCFTVLDSISFIMANYCLLLFQYVCEFNEWVELRGTKRYQTSVNPNKLLEMVVENNATFGLRDQQVRAFNN